LEGLRGKLGYFLAGVSAALAAYLGKTLVVSSSVSFAGALEILAASAFVASFIAGVKSLEFKNDAMAAKYRRLEHQSAAGRRVEEPKRDIVIDPVRDIIQTSEHLIEEGKQHDQSAQEQASLETKAESNAKSAYKWRNGLLIAGFSSLAASRLVPLVESIIHAMQP
jgi:hypothetical protein